MLRGKPRKVTVVVMGKKQSFVACFFAADVQCFGRDCYPVVFAVNTVLIIVATSKYIVERRAWYLLAPDPLQEGAFVPRARAET